MSVDVKFAVGQAAEYLKSLLGNVEELQLEEVVPSNTGGWLITFSFRGGGLPFLAKDYKQIEINGLGQPAAMRIRKVE